MFHILTAQLNGIARLAAEERATRIIVAGVVDRDGSRFVELVRGNGTSRHVKVNLKGEIA